FDLEAQGVAPATLRRQFRLRAAGLLAAGVLGGCVLGLVLSRLVVSVVRVSGTTAPPEPPLRLDVPLVSTLSGLGAVVAGLGSVSVLGTDVSRLDARAADAYRATALGLLDQHYARSLSPDLSCRQTVSLQLELLGRDAAASRAAADALLERVGLSARGDDLPG